MSPTIPTPPSPEISTTSTLPEIDAISQPIVSTPTITSPSVPQESEHEEADKLWIEEYEIEEDCGALIKEYLKWQKENEDI